MQDFSTAPLALTGSCLTTLRPPPVSAKGRRQLQRSLLASCAHAGEPDRKLWLPSMSSSLSRSLGKGFSGVSCPR